MLSEVHEVSQALKKTTVNIVSGFSPAGIDSGFLCTSSITTLMAFLLDPNISTADVYTTLPPKLWIEHDQMTVQWEPTDLELFPVAVASQYARLMGITAPPSTDNVATETATKVLSSSTRTPKLTAAPTVTSSTPNTVTTTPEPQSSPSGGDLHVTPTNNSTQRDINRSVLFVFLLVGTIMMLMV
ncbi:hypothetical protein EV127DRAFT_503937 [Xylaria flabelliformis]|nr:hypothetical protein EV127DRAFT_503937 [Xylaria flabelliformis]